MNAVARTRTAEPFGVLTEPTTLRMERILPGRIDRVWSYLTDGSKRAKWLAGGPMELRTGGKTDMTFRNSDLSAGQAGSHGPAKDGVDHVLHGLITRCDPPRVLSFNWEADGTGSESTFELSEDGPNTKMILTHRKLESRGQLLSVSGGWHTHIGILIDILSDEPPRLFWPEHERLAKEYAARFPE